MSDDTAQTTLGDEPADAADTADDESTTASTAAADTPADAQVTTVNARGHDDWIAERDAAEEPFAVRHVMVQIASDLSGTRYGLRSHTDVRYPGADDAHGQPVPQFGTCGISTETVLTSVRDWLLDILAYPYLPDFASEAADGRTPVRTIPAANCRVFVADRIDDLLRDTEPVPVPDALQVAIHTLNSLPEHASPPTEYRQTAAALHEIYEQIGHGATRGPLEDRERDIERTIRARCGFTSRYGHEVPDPAPEFAEADLNTLHDHLDATRAERDQLETRAETLTADLNRYREAWQATVRDDLDTLLEPLHPGGDGHPDYVGLSECCPVCGRRYGGSLVEAAGPCDDCMLAPAPPTIDWTRNQPDGPGWRA